MSADTPETRRGPEEIHLAPIDELYFLLKGEKPGSIKYLAFTDRLAFEGVSSKLSGVDNLTRLTPALFELISKKTEIEETVRNRKNEF